MAKSKKKPKTNPRIVPKKKKSKEFLRRSEAAKRGAQTKRINRLAAAKTALVNAKSKRKGKNKLSESGEIRFLKAKIEIIQKELSERWVHLQDQELLHRDGTLAVQPSRIRHMKDSMKFRQGLVDILRIDGERALTDVIRYWATKWDIPVQEFWTLIKSP